MCGRPSPSPLGPGGGVSSRLGSLDRIPSGHGPQPRARLARPEWSRQRPCRPPAADTLSIIRADLFYYNLIPSSAPARRMGPGSERGGSAGVVNLCSRRRRRRRLPCKLAWRPRTISDPGRERVFRRRWPCSFAEPLLHCVGRRGRLARQLWKFSRCRFRGSPAAAASRVSGVGLPLPWLLQAGLLPGAPGRPRKPGLAVLASQKKLPCLPLWTPPFSSFPSSLGMSGQPSKWQREVPTGRLPLGPTAGSSLSQKPLEGGRRGSPIKPKLVLPQQAELR